MFVLFCWDRCRHFFELTFLNDRLCAFHKLCEFHAIQIKGIFATLASLADSSLRPVFAFIQRLFTDETFGFWQSLKSNPFLSYF
jgi:hypothetical protein